VTTPAANTASSENPRRNGGIVRIAVSNCLGGALFQLLAWWLCASRPQRPQEIEALFHDLSRPVLLRARATPGHPYASTP
jgi:hypothetical protein